MIKSLLKFANSIPGARAAARGNRLTIELNPKLFVVDVCDNGDSIVLRAAVTNSVVFSGSLVGAQDYIVSQLL